MFLGYEWRELLLSPNTFGLRTELSVLELLGSCSSPLIVVRQEKIPLSRVFLGRVPVYDSLIPLSTLVHGGIEDVDRGVCRLVRAPVPPQFLSIILRVMQLAMLKPRAAAKRLPQIRFCG